MRHYLSGGLLVLGILLGRGAYGEVVQGTIAYLDPTNQLIGIREVHGPVKPAEMHVLTFDDEVKTHNVSSVKELQLGQEVTVKADKNVPGTILAAKAIEVSA